MVVVAARDVRQVRAEVLAEVKDHLRAVLQEGPSYIDAYVRDTYEGRQRTPSLGGMHPLAGKLLREVTLDVLHAGAGLRMGA